MFARGHAEEALSLCYLQTKATEGGKAYIYISIASEMGSPSFLASLIGPASLTSRMRKLDRARVMAISWLLLFFTFYTLAGYVSTGFFFPKYFNPRFYDKLVEFGEVESKVEMKLEGETDEEYDLRVYNITPEMAKAELERKNQMEYLKNYKDERDVGESEEDYQERIREERKKLVKEVYGTKGEGES